MDWLILYVVIAIDTYLFLAASPCCAFTRRAAWGVWYERETVYLFLIPGLGVRYEIKVDTAVR